MVRLANAFRYFTREILYVIGSLCSIYAVVYLFNQEELGCKLWAVLSAVVVGYLASLVIKLLMKKKNKELKKMAERKKELEISLLGDQRLSSGYDPDRHIF